MSRVLAESIVSNPEKPLIFASENIIKASCEKFLKGYNNHHENILIRSESDKFDYRIVQLENGIRILLVSDPTSTQLTKNNDETSDLLQDELKDDDDLCEEMSNDSNDLVNKVTEKMAAIIVAVKVGSFQDPREIPGMAHMLEHLLTMGSEKYPAENEIDEFLSTHGSYQNAQTEMEHTIYEIKVHSQFVEQAINLIGHAFLHPLLRRESIEKEIKPIDTEFVEASNDDDHRLEVFLSHLANSDHPLNKFSWGNKKSLIEDPKAKNIDVQKELVKFYQLYYKPENIVVVVQSQESLENLEKWTSSVFGLIKFNSNSFDNMEKNDWEEVLPFEESRFHRVYFVESIDSGTRLIINWCLLPVVKQYLINSNDYWASLVGYEGKGSLITVLRDQNLAIELYIDSEMFCFTNNHKFSIFSIDIHLTEKGLSNLGEVVRLLFEYLSVIQKSGVQEYYFREKQIIALNSFNKKSEKDSLTYSIELAKNLLYFPIEHVFTGNSLYYHFDKETIENYGNQLRPDKANFVVLNKKLQDKLEINIEPWMNICYQSMEVPKEWITQIGNGSKYFHYPKPNRFIATNFQLLSETLPSDCMERKQGDFPMKIIEESRIIVWHKTDFKFALPKASLNLHLLSPFNNTPLDNLALNLVLQEYLNVDLLNDVYDAFEADLKYDLSRSMYGITLTAKGFNEKLTELILIILERFFTVDFSSDLLKSVKKDLTKFYKNHNQDSATFNREILCNFLVDKYHLHFELIPKIQEITKEDLIEYKKKVLSDISLELLVQGNISIKETFDFCERIKLMFDLPSKNDPPMDKIKHRVIKIPCGFNRIRMLTLAKTNRMSFIRLYQQLGPFELRSKCYLSLFTRMLNEQCFHILRTCEGLGYFVGCNNENMFDILGFSIVVSSDADKFDCSFVVNRIKNFLQDYCQKEIGETLTESKFEEFVSSQIIKKLSPDLSLEMEAQKNWKEIISYDLCFDRIKKEVAQLQQANLNDFRRWVSEHILCPLNEGRVLTIEVVGNGDKALEECMTFDSKPVDKHSIGNNEKSHTFQLLRSKDEKMNNFISDINEFKENLEFYPPQMPLKNLMN